jgi:tetratricopeptide (TPR) repeat protein
MYSSLLWASATASAQEAAPPSADVTTASAMLRIEPIAPVDEDFERGLEAMKAARPRDAVGAFEAAYARTQDPQALLQIGVAYAALAQPHAAVKALQSYVDHADTQRDAVSIDAAKQEIARLSSESGHIGVHLIPADAKVTMDGQMVDVSAGELLAAPGQHNISATAEGYKPVSQTVDVVPGRFTLEVQLQRVDTSIAAVALAAPAITTDDAALREATDEPEASAASSCLLAKVCLGPVVSLLGPPNLIGGGLHARIGRYLGVGVDYQALPKLTFSQISVGTSLVSANARVYPFGGAFFLSGGIGYQSVRGEIREGDISLSARTGFPAAMASIGFMGHDGFVLGADLGLLFPLSSMRVSLHENAAALTQNGVSQDDIDSTRTKAENRVNKVLDAVPLLVQVNLIRIGYMF